MSTHRHQLGRATQPRQQLAGRLQADIWKRVSQRYAGGNRAPTSSSPIFGGTNRTTVIHAESEDRVRDASPFIVTRSAATKTISMTGTSENPVARRGPRTDGAVTVAAPAAAFNSMIPDDCSTYIVATASALASGSLTMPRNPSTNRIVRIVSTQEITNFSLNAHKGQPISGPLAKLAGNKVVAYMYTGTAWRRLESQGIMAG